MSAAVLTRRAALSGAVAAVAGMAAASAAISAPSISGMEQHWLKRCAAFREFEADPRAPDDQDVTEAYWGRIDAAEIAIVADRSGTSRAAEVQLWVAWLHAHPSTAKASTLVQQGDIPALKAIFSGLNWHEKAFFAAITNLRGEG